VFASGVRSLEQNVSNPFERATAFFLFGSLQEFFFDGNKRTSRFMMNGLLMTQGIDAISIPAVRATEFNSRMVDFYTSRDATEMMAFVLDCHPEVSQIRQLNPGLSAVKDLPDIEYFSLSDSLKRSSDVAHSTGRVDRAAAADLEAVPVRKQPARIFSIEETRREARENWRRRNYYDKRVSQREPQKDSRLDAEKDQPERDAGEDFDPEW
jgi:prophage maintenance system killer protein